MLYVVRHKPNRPGARWRRVGIVATLAEAVALIVSGGDWWITQSEGDA